MTHPVLKLVADLPLATRTRLAKILAPAPEPIAILGMGCRFPGASSPDALWRLLMDGGDAIREVPGDRWPIDAYYHADPHAPGTMNTRWGAFLPGIDGFDAAFFGISPREAAQMDPQQRLLLEVAWEALERAGQPPDELAGSQTGVFVGIYYQDYAFLRSGDVSMLDAYSVTGMSHGIAANRLSYQLDLRGPSIAVDTACSSSLVAVHLACQSLRAAECDVALCGAVSLMLAPAPTIALTKWDVLAPDGRCKVFDARADGFVRGEGCGVVVLKRLADALASGDPIRAVIRGTAVNQDGRSNGLTAPSGPAQRIAIARALAQAGIDPGQVGYVEAHGTGTALGDPIELEALDAALTSPSRRHRCAVGAIKANLGHLEAAAGIAGLIKAVLIVERGAMPPQIHLERPNPHFDLAASCLEIPTGRQAWRDESTSTRERRVAGVSAFGFGGTNAHVVIEEAPAPSDGHAPAAPQSEGGVNRSPGDGRPQVLALSARSAKALQSLAAAYSTELREASDSEAAAMCVSAARRRSHHRECRLAVIGSTARALANALDLADVRQLSSAPAEAPAIVFVASGRLVPPRSFRRALFANEPAFREAVARCAVALAPHVGSWSVESAFDKGPDGDDPTRFPIVAWTAEVALAALWQAWGVAPAAVVGCGPVDWAAAVVEGRLELADAARLVAGHAERRDRVPPDPRVSWEPALKQLAGGPPPIVLDLGNADESLVGAVETLWPGANVLRSWSADTTDRTPLLESLAALYTRRQNINWKGVYPAAGRFVSLPTYRWDRKHYWLDPPHAAAGPRGASDVLAGKLYDVTWQAAAHAPAAHPNPPAGTWLIVGSDDELSRQIGESVRKYGGYAATALSMSSEALRTATADRWSPFRGVIYLACCASGAYAAAAPALAAQVDRCEALLHLLRAMAAEFGTAHGEGRPRLWVVTRGVQPVEGTSPTEASLNAAPVWGIGRTAALEMPEVWGGLIDLDDALPVSNAAEAVVAELMGDGDEDQVAVRGGQRYVARLARVECQDVGAPPVLRDDATYLVTGGFGGLGLRVARWLVDRGARNLVLLGRRAPGEEAMARIDALKLSGARVVARCADVADTAVMACVFREIASGPPLGGVIHAAGVLHRDAIGRLEADTFASTLGAKAAGAWTLHQLTIGCDLDFFLLFSSAASVWGSRELAAYAAANHVLDALAHRRRSRGLPAVSINWGPVRAGGMPVADAEPQFAQIGITPLNDDEWTAALDRIVTLDRAQLTVASVDWAAFTPVYASKRRRPFLDRIARQSPGVTQDSDGGDLLVALRNADVSNRRDLLGAHVRAEVARILGCSTADEVPTQEGFFALGMDSLTAVQLRTSLEKALRCQLASTVVFDFPTVEALAGRLCADTVTHSGGQPPAPIASPARSGGAGTRVTDRVDVEIDTDIAALLDRELAAADRLLNGH